MASRRLRAALLGTSVFGMLGLTAGAGSGLGQGDVVATSDHEAWLEVEVGHIISDAEREVFRSLTTLEERQAFVEAFWRHRDPNPATAENEFRVEHYRRLEHANRFYGRETSLPGWKTERGRIHILLGPPREKQVFDGMNEIVSTEIWFYSGDVSSGLPPFFYVAFYKKHDLGDYRLYHPVLDGPRALVRSQYAIRGDDAAAWRRLHAVSPELARASLSLDPSDPGDSRTGQASIGADALLARIDDYPTRFVRTDYADAWMRYGKRVGADYSFNYVPHRSRFVVLPGPDGTWFVHYSLELESAHFTMETDEGRSRFYTTLDVDVEVTDGDGRLVEGFQKEVPVALTPAQANEVGASSFSYQEAFPLIPGRFTVRVILRNRAPAQYTVAEANVRVPPVVAEGAALSEIVLAYHVEPPGAASPNRYGPFQLNDESTLRRATPSSSKRT